MKLVLVGSWSGPQGIQCELQKKLPGAVAACDCAGTQLAIKVVIPSQQLMNSINGQESNVNDDVMACSRNDQTKVAGRHLLEEHMVSLNVRLEKVDNLAPPKGTQEGALPPRLAERAGLWSSSPTNDPEMGSVIAFEEVIERL